VWAWVQGSYIKMVAFATSVQKISLTWQKNCPHIPSQNITEISRVSFPEVEKTVKSQ
jgi:hypothetical protein